MRSDRRGAWDFQVLLSDARYGLRMLARSPAFTFTALVAIALGIGATTAVFSLVNAVLLRSLPYGDVQKLVYIWTPNPKLEGTPRELGPSNADFFDWKRLSHSFSAMTTFDPRVFTLQRSGRVARIGGARVDGNFFSTLQAKPELGRAIGEEDARPDSARVAMIGDALWRSEFGADPHILGKALRLNRDEYTIIGVMPPPFNYPHEGDFPYGFEGAKRADVWIPLVFNPKQMTDRMGDDGIVVARLGPSAGLERAQAEMSGIEAQLDPLWPAEFRGWQALVVPFVDSSVGAVRTMLWLLLGAVSFVLLIACANVANLLAARAVSRAHEMGVRAALGAGRARLIRQMLIEALLLAAGGAVLGVLVAYGAVRFVVGLNPGDIPRLAEMSLDARVLLFTLAASVATGLVFGILPALSASRVNISEMLQQGGTRGTIASSNRLRHGLIVSEVALAVVLLAGSGLLIRSYLKLQAVDTGFSPSTVTMSLSLDEGYSTPPQQIAFVERLMDEIERLPGVASAAAVNALPLTNHGSLTFLEVRGYANRKTQLVDSRSVTPHYFNAMNIPLLAGRHFEKSDAPGSAVLVDRRFASVYFRGQNPIGQQIRTSGDPKSPWARVIGLVGDVRHASIEEEPRPAVYTPYAWSPGPRVDMAIRARVPSWQVISSTARILQSMDSAIGFVNARTMGERVGNATARRRFQTTVLAVFAAVALFLAMVGLYGLMAYAVRRRTAEIGIRMALGASRGQVLTMMLRQGLGLVAVGLAVGLIGALALTRLVSSWLYGVSATDPVTFVVVPLLLLCVAVCACLIPGYRASRIEPLTALRDL